MLSPMQSASLRAGTIAATTDRRAALDGADYVIVTFQVGGLDAYRHDVEIPRRYGLDQTVGDTLGPGGVFRFLRSAPAFEKIGAQLALPGAGVLVVEAQKQLYRPILRRQLSRRMAPALQPVLVPRPVGAAARGAPIERS